MGLEPGLAFLEKAAEVAFDAQDAVGINAVEFNDLGGGGFKEVAVVAYGDDGEGRCGEQFFEPLDAGEVEVISGFVEEEDIGLAGERFDDREALAPAAGEGIGFDVEGGEA